MLHATWNAVAKNFADLRDSFALINIGVFLTCVVALPFVGIADSRAVWYLAAAVVVHQTYELALMVAYRHGDLSKSYPLARGVAPLLVSLGGFVFAGERMDAFGVAGLFVIVAGISLLAVQRTGHVTSLTPVAWALATGAAIAAYTVIDGLGVRASHSAPRYAVTLFLLQSSSWLVAVTVRRGWSWRPSLSKTTLGMLGGILSMVGYFTVLWAQTKAAMGAVSALRETGVLWASIFGVVFFREGNFRRIVPPAMLIVVGVAFLSVG